MAISAYKKNQGRPTRQIALCVLAAALSWLLISIIALTGVRQVGVQWLAICSVAIVVSGFLAVVLLNKPRWADFLISVQGEIDKVTWPTSKEVRRATAVVMALIVTMAVVLFCFDLIWQWVFKTIGFLQI